MIYRGKDRYLKKKRTYKNKNSKKERSYNKFGNKNTFPFQGIRQAIIDNSNIRLHVEDVSKTNDNLPWWIAGELFQKNLHLCVDSEHEEDIDVNVEEFPKDKAGNSTVQNVKKVCENIDIDSIPKDYFYQHDKTRWNNKKKRTKERNENRERKTEK